MNKLPQLGSAFLAEFSGSIAEESVSDAVAYVSSAIEQAIFEGLYLVRWKTKKGTSHRCGQSAPMRKEIAQEVVWRNNKVDPSVRYWIEPAFAG